MMFTHVIPLFCESVRLKVSKREVHLSTPAILALADGSIFHGTAIGAQGHSLGEVAFSTAMSGYQELLTDPVSAGQLLAMTYPHIGNSGINPQDGESDRIHAAGLIIRDLPLVASNWRSTQSLQEFLQAGGTVGIADIDTRRLVRILRDKGTQAGCILSGADATADRALELVRGFTGQDGQDLAGSVSTATAYDWNTAPWQLASNSNPQVPAEQLPWKVVVYDFGVSRSLLQDLVAKGCHLTVVPAATPAAEVLAQKPNGVVLSSGPGNANACTAELAITRELLDAGIPLFGTGLGHQLLALASGAQVKRLPVSRIGVNQPVKDLASGQALISSQHHSFVVDAASLPASLKLTHISLLDDSVQGIEVTGKPAIGFQGVPHLSSEPNTSSAFYDRFVELMKQAQKA